MRVVITGGTGLVGRALVAQLLAGGAEVVGFTRRPGEGGYPEAVREVRWPDFGAGTPPPVDGDWARWLEGADAVVHLAGASIAEHRWSAAYKQRILASRVEGTRALVEAIARARQRPPVLISGSATGYYGDRGDSLLTEEAPPGRDFLAEVCRRWEAEAERAGALGVRVVRLRTGLVLAREGGALPRLLAPFRLLGGGPLGSGRQWVSWIHLQDLARLVRFLLEEPVEGAVNAVAPDPVTNRALVKAIGDLLHRPSWICVPAPLVRAVAGEMGATLLLRGQRVVPRRALALGFRFQHPTIHDALRDLLAAPA